MKIKKTIAEILIASTLGIGGGLGVVQNDINQAEQAQIAAEAKIREATEITQKNISDFQNDLEIMGIETEQAKNLAEYFFGNILVGKKESISISEMQAIVSVYNKVIQETGERNFGEIKDGKEFIRKANKLVEKTAKSKKK